VLLGVLHGVEPGGGVVGAVKVKAVGVEHLVHGDVAVRGLDDHGVLLQAADDGLELGHLLGGHEVGLVEHDGGAELELLDERLSMSSSSMSSASRSLPPLNSSYMRAQSTTATMLSRSSGAPPLVALVAEGRDGVGDGDGLADARGLDDDVVEVAGLRDAAQLLGQVVGERAADAAVGDGDEAVGLSFTRPPSLA
jgi:hypothetical protein